MARALNIFSSTDMDFSQPLDKNGRQKPVSQRLRIWTETAAMSSIATVEMPLLAVIMLIIAVSVAVAPDTSLRVIDLNLPAFFICPFYALTDIPCIFCGMTRSFMAMGGLDIRQAFIFHPLGPFLYLAMLFIGFGLIASVISRRHTRFSVAPGPRVMMIRLGTAVAIVAWMAKIIIWSKTGLL